MKLLIRNAEILREAGEDAWQVGDVLVEDGKVAKVRLEGDIDTFEGADEVIDAEGGALLPGLHDHHIHFLSLAESFRSLKVGPPEVKNKSAFLRCLKEASGEGWIRAIGYHESVAGELGKCELDEIVRDRPLRIQHSSGAMWMLNSAGIQALGLTAETIGAEVDEHGKLTGRFFRSDERLRTGAIDQMLEREMEATQKCSHSKQNLSENTSLISKAAETLVSYGVTGITDATPGYGQAEVEFFQKLSADICLNITLMVKDSSAVSLSSKQNSQAHLSIGDKMSCWPRKIMLSDHSLPAFAELSDEIKSAHERGQPVAVHSVTRTSLALLVAVLNEVASIDGDRVEHASVAPPDLVSELVRHNVRVVVQPHFISERGDRYLEEVDVEDIAWLYRVAGLLDAGLRVAGGTDAPFGNTNPWKAMWAAVKRRTVPGGKLITPEERIAPDQALDLFLSPPDDPGGKPKRVSEGMPADLCLLSKPWSAVSAEMSENPVRLTVFGGKILDFGE